MIGSFVCVHNIVDAGGLVLVLLDYQWEELEHLYEQVELLKDHLICDLVVLDELNNGFEGVFVLFLVFEYWAHHIFELI